MLMLHPSHVGGRRWPGGVFHLAKHQKKTLFTRLKFLLMLTWQGRARERRWFLPALPLHQAWHGQHVLRGVKHGCTSSSTSEWWPLVRSQHFHAPSSPVGQQVFLDFSVTGSGTSYTNHCIFSSGMNTGISEALWISIKSKLGMAMKHWHEGVLACLLFVTYRC